MAKIIKLKNRDMTEKEFRAALVRQGIRFQNDDFMPQFYYKDTTIFNTNRLTLRDLLAFALQFKEKVDADEARKEEVRLATLAETGIEFGMTTKEYAAKRRSRGLDVARYRGKPINPYLEEYDRRKRLALQFAQADAIDAELGGKKKKDRR